MFQGVRRYLPIATLRSWLLAGGLFLQLAVPTMLHGADPLASWTLISAQPTLRGVVAGPDRLVAVGDRGTILSSTNAVDWVQAISGVTNQLNAVAYMDGEFIVVGHESRILRSSDGLTWIRGTFGTGHRFRSVATGPQGIVACGENGVVRVRNQGGTWDLRRSGTQEHLNGMAQSAEATVIVGDFGEILRSTNLLDWVRVESGVFEDLHAVTFLDGEFLAVGGAGVLLSSPDGIDWSDQVPWIEADYRDLAKVGEGAVVVVGGMANGVANIAITSVAEDWVSWMDSPVPANPLNGLASFGAGLIGVGEGGVIAITRDGLEWETLQGSPLGTIGAMAQTPAGWSLTPFAGREPVPLDRWEASRLARVSYRMVETNRCLVEIPPIHRAAERGGHWVAVGANPYLWVSSDGRNWQLGGEVAGATFRDVIAAEGRFFAVGEMGFAGVVASSIDGRSWTVEALQEGGALNQIAHGNGRMVAVGDHGARLTSTRGGPWVSTGTPWAYAVSGLAYGNGRFVAVVDSVLQVSSDGLEWRKPETSPGNLMLDVEFGAGRFLASGFSGNLYTSTNGSTWRQTGGRQFETGWVSLGWTGDRFVAGGVEGSFAWSDPIEGLPPTFLVEPKDVSVIAGFPMKLEATVVEAEPLAYQWYKDGLAVPGAIRSSLELDPAGVADSGTYWLLASNRLGSVQSAPISLTVSPERPADHWELLRNPCTGVVLDRCARGPNRFVATTETGGLAVSTNGYVWEERPSITPFRLTQIRYLNDHFLVLGGNGFVARSEDGLAWTSISVPAQVNLRDAVLGGGKWVLVGDEGTVISSTDLKAWRVQTNRVPGRLRGICWTGSQFYVAGDHGYVLSSSDAFSWRFEGTGVSAHLTAIAAGSNVVLAVGDHGTTSYKVNGSWWGGEPSFNEWVGDLSDVAWSEGRFYAVGPRTAGVMEISASNGGVSRAGGLLRTRNPRWFSAVCPAPDGVFAVGGTALMVPNRLGPWTSVAGTGTATLLDIADVAGRLVAVGDQGCILVSADARQWQTVSSGTARVLVGVAGLQGSGVVVGAKGHQGVGGEFGPGGVLLYSGNGVEWAELPGITTNNLRAVCAGGGRYVAGGDLGTLLVSEDGKKWISPEPVTRDTIYGLVHDGNQFWGITHNLVLKSADGLSWTTNRLAPADKRSPVVFDGGRLAFLERGQLRQRRMDGSLEPAAIVSEQWLSSLAGSGSTLVAVSDSSTAISMFRNGTQWSTVESGQPWNLHGVRHINGAFYAVGQYGVILRSGPEARLSLRRPAAGSVELRLSGTAGRRFRLQRSDSVDGKGSWLDLGPGTEDGSGRIWTRPESADAEEGYFRAVLEE